MACIVVPVYQMPLRKFEWTSLNRCVAVLGSHPIVIIKPESLDVTEILRTHSELTCENFSDQCFLGIGGYNQLMLSDDFYARFARYEYILIHQLDALVFEDRLRDWCERGYDYVGAPWMVGESVPTLRERIRNRVRRTYYRWIDLRAPNQALDLLQYAYSVGNGGFSLRRVAKMRAALAKHATTADRYRNGDTWAHHEDMFFSVEANRYWPRLSIPSWRKAAHFAWELNPRIGAAVTGGQLPFGCHAWDKYHRDDWRPIFSKLGLCIDDLLNNGSTRHAVTRPSE